MPIAELEKIEKFRAFNGKKDGPVKILGAGLDASEACSLACPYCYRPNGEAQSGYMLPEIASKIMHKLKSGGVSEIYLLGAEPTSNPVLPQILKEAVDMDFKFVLLISNGLKIADQNYARQVLIPGVSLLMQRHTLESDAFAQKIQEASVGKQGTLEQSHAAWENAEKIFKEKGRDKLMMQCCLTDAVMSNGNLDRLFKFSREKLQTLPIMEYVSPTHVSREGQLEWLTTYPLLTKRIVTQLEKFRKIDEELGLADLAFQDAVSPQAYNSSCTMSKEGGQIANDGVFMPCTNMGRGSTNPLQYGNILLESFEPIEQSPIRRAFIEPDFRVQNCKNPCQGSGCWWTGLVTTGCYRLCQLNCVFNEEKKTIDDIPDLCKNCKLDSLRKEGNLKCGPGTRPGLVLGEAEKIIFKC